jgi:hypothetical protein
MRQPRVGVPAEVALQDLAFLRAIEDGAPLFQLADALGSLLSMELSHSPLVQVLASFHRVAEMHLPLIARIDIRQRGRDAPFGHDGVGFS